MNKQSLPGRGDGVPKIKKKEKEKWSDPKRMD